MLSDAAEIQKQSFISSTRRVVSAILQFTQFISSSIDNNFCEIAFQYNIHIIVIMIIISLFRFLCSISFYIFVYIFLSAKENRHFYSKYHRYLNCGKFLI